MVNQLIYDPERTITDMNISATFTITPILLSPSSTPFNGVARKMKPKDKTAILIKHAKLRILVPR